MANNINQKLSLPFKVISSDVEGGFIDEVHSAFTGGIDLVNYHEDKYGELDGGQLQSPFTEAWVGGHQHRHVPLNIGNDNSSTRKEAWHLEFNSNGVRFYSHAYRNSPPAYWTRDLLAKSPINIKNIQSITSSANIGNYTKNYEIVQTSGRRISNSLIADDLIAGNQFVTRFISGQGNYILPSLDGKKDKSVIVERFNAPGSKEESSRGSLDREGEEYSPNSPVAFRNIKIRKPFYSDLSVSAEQFGPSIHGVNRNTLIRAGNVQRDNGFVVHSIPRTDIQYSWIKHSTDMTPAELGGYQSFGGSYNRPAAYTDIPFQDGYLLINPEEDFSEQFVDNLFINSMIKQCKRVDPDNRIQYIQFDECLDLQPYNHLMYSFSEVANSNYTFSNWRSIRNYDTPLARYLKKNNILPVEEKITPSNKKVFQFPYNFNVFSVSGLTRKSQSSINYVEPLVSFKYRPLKDEVILSGTDAGQSQIIRHTYTNNLSTFANKSLLDRLNQKDDRESSFYRLLKELYSNASAEGNPVDKYVGYRYKEVIWPKEENTGLSKTRKRNKYYLDKGGWTRDGYDIQLGTQRAFWRDSRLDRRRSRSDENLRILLDDISDPILTSTALEIYVAPGGHINSMNYLSYDEEGEDFYITGSTSFIGLTSDEVFSTDEFNYATYLDVKTDELQNGLHNSVRVFDEVQTESIIYSASLLVTQQVSSSIILPTELNVCYKRGNYWSLAGELNTDFVDWYGISTISGSARVKDLGAVYRNSYYKALMTTKQYEFGSTRDILDNIDLIRTEDDEIYINPKLKYVAFTGGGELNKSLWIQENFKEYRLENEGEVQTITNTVTQYTSFYDPYASFTNTTKLVLKEPVSITNDGTTGFVRAETIASYVPLGEPPTGPTPTYTFSKILVLDIESLASGQPNPYYFLFDTLNTGLGLPYLNNIKISKDGNFMVFHYSFNGQFLKFLRKNGATWNSATPVEEYVETRNASDTQKITIDETGNYVFISYVDEADNNKGAIDVYYKDPSTGWSKIQTYKRPGVPSNPLLGDGFGTSIDIVFEPGFGGNLLVIGAFRENEVKIYTLANGIGLVDASVLLTIPLGIGNSLRGVTVATGGGIIAVSSPGQTVNGLPVVGVVDVYRQNVLIDTITPPVIEVDAFFGDKSLHVSSDGKYIAVVSTSDPYTRVYINDGQDNYVLFDSFAYNGFNFDITKDFSKTIGRLSDQRIIIENLQTVESQITVTSSIESPPVATNIPDTLFVQNFTKDDIVFSTLDNGLKRVTERDSGKKPYYDSYEDYIEDIRGLGKEYSIIPEFRISEHMDYYVNDANGNFYDTNRSFLEIDGIGLEYASAETENSEYNRNFFLSYATSDLLKKEQKVYDDNEGSVNIDSITIKVDGIKKLLPYNGFYPQDRITQIANLYSDYVENSLGGGIYNISYEETGGSAEIIDHQDVQQGSNFVNKISTVEFDGYFYTAISYHSHNARRGLVKVYRNKGSEILNKEDWDQQELVSYFGKSQNQNFGANIKLIVGKDGLELYISDWSAKFNGKIYRFTSSDGTTWPNLDWSDSTTVPSITPKGNSDSYFGTDFDVDYYHYYDDDAEADEHRYVLLVGAPADDIIGQNATYRGQAYLYTSLNGEDWDEKGGLVGNNIMDADSQLCNIGIAVSILRIPRASIGPYSGIDYEFYVAFSKGKLSQDTITQLGTGRLGASGGGIFSFASPWSPPGNNLGNLYPKLVVFSNSSAAQNYGHGGIKSVLHNGGKYVFYGQSTSSNNGKTQNGLIAVSYRLSVHHEWYYAEDQVLKLVTLKVGEESYDKIPYVYPNIHIELEYPMYGNITAVSANDKLFYSFSAAKINNGTLFLGYSSDGDQYWTNGTDNTLVPINLNYREATPLSVEAVVSGSVAYAMYADTENVYISPFSIDRNVTLSLTVESEEAKKAYRHAAIEPLMAPGIIYNTVKSGIAVDWPCTTGSVSVIKADNRLINNFYPESKIMDSYEGLNGTYNIQGNLRSQINYRISFENSIYIKEIFEEKNELLTDIYEVYNTEQPVPTSNTFITDYLQGCYIYGGYEPYISPTDVGDFNGQTAKRFSVPFVYKKTNSRDSELYTRAVSNFYAECVKFFLKEEKMTTFVSRPDNEWSDFLSGSVYYMDIVLDKSEDLVMIEAYHDDKHPIGDNGEKMNGRYFGYPVNKTTKQLWSQDSANMSGSETRLMFNDPAYAPYTPAYFEGRAIARLSFRPERNGRYKLDELFSKLEIEDIYPVAQKGWQEGSDAQKHKMSIGSSFDLFGSFQAVATSITSIQQGSNIQDRSFTQNLENKIWVISPRLETPVLDFSDQEIEPYETNYIKTSGFGRGMWSGYGKIPDGNKALKMSITFPFFRENSASYRFGKVKNKVSLLEHVGFQPGEKKIGNVADSKIISEAIVLIPYTENNNGNVKYNQFLQKYVFKLDKEIYETQKYNLESGKAAVLSGEFGAENDVKQTTISRMIQKMDNYILPPMLSFHLNKNIEPFVMYMFEFKYKFDTQDLVDIWQGVMPSIATNAELASIDNDLADDNVITHKMHKYEFFHGNKLPDDTRWLIFKVKKKSEFLYENVTKNTKDDLRFQSELKIGREAENYSYNWPYDYFTLVELAKVEIDLEYKNLLTEEQKRFLEAISQG